MSYRPAFMPLIITQDQKEKNRSLVSKAIALWCIPARQHCQLPGRGFSCLVVKVRVVFQSTGIPLLL